jgi:uncharacterized hydrophobic protein (TIGR00341 family)
MTLRLISVDVAEEAAEPVRASAERAGAEDVRVLALAAPGGRARVEMLAGTDTRQAVLDEVQAVLASREGWRIALMPVETTIPLPEEEREEQARAEAAREAAVGGLTREEIMGTAWEQSRIGRDYLVFVALSAVVAAFGMVEDNVAVVIGAMVIAPLLGPVLAFSVGVALGEGALLLRAAGAAAAGIALAAALGGAVGGLLPVDVAASELVARADVGAGGLAIALASGAAAALSLATGVAGALVGVMVAVALLPPATAAGLFVGAGRLDLAQGAGLLLAVNVVCVNIAAQAVLWARGVTPRSWAARQRARRGSVLNAALWLGLLAALAALLWLRAPQIGPPGG